MRRSKCTLLVVDNAHIYKTADGKYYAPSLYDDTFFKRYLNVFDKVRLVAKTKHVESIDPERYIHINVPGLEIHELPWTQGIAQLVKRLFSALWKYRTAGFGTHCAIYRVSQLESYLAYFFRNRKQPYFLEVVNDPETFVHLPKILRRVNQWMLKLMLSQAKGAAFVTEYTLQKKYLSGKQSASASYVKSHYSSIELKCDWIQSPKIYEEPLNNVRIAHVSNSIDNDIKGHRTVLEAAAYLNQKSVNIEIFFIGDGSHVGQLKSYAEYLGISSKIEFVGRIHDRSRLLSKLRQADLFVYPTQLEGLPRAVIEAMAVGLPVVSTPIAGIPELLDERYLFEPNDSMGFALCIDQLRQQPAELTEMSRKNVEVAKKYSKEILDKRRADFYQKLYLLAVASQ